MKNLAIKVLSLSFVVLSLAGCGEKRKSSGSISTSFNYEEYCDVVDPAEAADFNAHGDFSSLITSEIHPVYTEATPINSQIDSTTYYKKNADGAYVLATDTTGAETYYTCDFTPFTALYLALSASDAYPDKMVYTKTEGSKSYERTIQRYSKDDSFVLHGEFDENGTKVGYQVSANGACPVYGRIYTTRTSADEKKYAELPYSRIAFVQKTSVLSTKEISAIFTALLNNLRVYEDYSELASTGSSTKWFIYRLEPGASNATLHMACSNKVTAKNGDVVISALDLKLTFDSKTITSFSYSKTEELNGVTTGKDVIVSATYSRTGESAAALPSDVTVIDPVSEEYEKATIELSLI